MSVRNLEFLLNPRSIAVIGASNRPNRVGTVVTRNLREAGFAGAIYPVNPKYDRVQGIPPYSRVDGLPAAPDLALICTPPASIPELIARLGERGTRAAVVFTAGLNAAPESGEAAPMQAMLEAARPHLLRILGPNCI